MMLVARPILDFQKQGTPRIISEIKKREPISPLPLVRPRISGDLLVKCAHENRWWPRRVTIRGGQLHVSTGPGEGSPTTIRIPLRQMSLKAGPLPNSLALCKGQNVLLTLQTGSERAFDLWVKTLAIELIRQTPLVLVKYLDILSLTDSRRKHPEEDDHCNENQNHKRVKRDLFNAKTDQNDLNLTQTDGDGVHRLSESEDENANRKQQHVPLDHVEEILLRCQESDRYVPVRDKLVLFESLSRLGRKVRSSEDVSLAAARAVDAKRHRSLHDLTDCVATTAVREICKYFERKSLGGDREGCGVLVE